MRYFFIIALFMAFSNFSFGQVTETSENQYLNVADRLLMTDGKLMIGGYGEVHYNQPIDGSIHYNGTLDVHRMVLLFGYNFNSKTQFITELEFEHVSEVYIEQAFLQHKINSYINLRGGLLLIPMGIVNEYHEPATFNGVERPLIDNKIAPTTWREVGLGVTGTLLELSLKYQAYLVNGFNGYDGTAKLSGKNGFRNGRQKGAESYMSSPNFTAKAEYYGIRGLNLGLSGYFGDTQSKLYNGVDKSNVEAMAKADSSVVGIAMVGVDARYTQKAIQLRCQLYYSSISNADAYNQFTAINGKPNDVGRSMAGYYIEAGYNVLQACQKSKTELIPFVRFESYNTHQSVGTGLSKNLAYRNHAITTGISYHLAKGVLLKADLQFNKSASSPTYSQTINSGIGIMF